ncbi:MAG: 4-alpha-glucanotransferase [Cyanobacteria bacterium]|nr:4-alpha-glucanotransferase [Cyanobacteriota bacterium]
MPFQRASGIILHPTSLPSPFGMGDLGQAAYEFVNFLADTGQQIWQLLPLGPTGHGNSPYMCYSAMAGNPMLISLEALRDQGLLSPEDLEGMDHFPTDTVDYGNVIPERQYRLEKAAAAFRQIADPDTRLDFQNFCSERAFWLDDYALFMALKQAHQGASWHQWDRTIACREPHAMAHWQEKLAVALEDQKFYQFEFHRQWAKLRAYANERHIQIIGDMPIYVAHDSADVWAFPENFMIDEDTLKPSEMAGVPPDYFSATGQLWGNPTYNWEEVEKQGFKWWLQRLKALLDYVDLIRIDHFRGFEAYWAVPEGETTAMNGTWVEAPGEAFFNAVKAEFGSLPILAEDLGVITPEVEALRDQFGFPGMKILQFAFGSDHMNPYLPFNCVRNCLIYSGTHDNDTTVGWFEGLADYERDRVLRYLGGLSADGIHWDLIRLAFTSIANQAIVPLQDLLGLGSDARMNTPGEPEGNWAWRYRPETVTEDLRYRLRELTRLCARAPLHWYQ